MWTSVLTYRSGTILSSTSRTSRSRKATGSACSTMVRPSQLPRTSASAGTRSRRRQADGLLGRLGRRGPGAAQRARRRQPGRRQRGALGTLSGLSLPRRARLPSSETAAALDPEQGSEAPTGRGCSSPQTSGLSGPREPGLVPGALAAAESLHVAGCLLLRS